MSVNFVHLVNILNFLKPWLICQNSEKLVTGENTCLQHRYDVEFKGLRGKKTFSLGIEFDSETTGCGFHIVNNLSVRQTRSLILLVNDNMEILMYV